MLHSRDQTHPFFRHFEVSEERDSGKNNCLYFDSLSNPWNLFKHVCLLFSIPTNSNLDYQDVGRPFK